MAESAETLIPFPSGFSSSIDQNEEEVWKDILEDATISRTIELVSVLAEPLYQLESHDGNESQFDDAVQLGTSLMQVEELEHKLAEMRVTIDEQAGTIENLGSALGKVSHFYISSSLVEISRKKLSQHNMNVPFLYLYHFRVSPAFLRMLSPSN
jgi:hypothetical protein